jgi:hypothetical protein
MLKNTSSIVVTTTAQPSALFNHTLRSSQGQRLLLARQLMEAALFKVANG